MPAEEISKLQEKIFPGSPKGSAFKELGKRIAPRRASVAQGLKAKVRGYMGAKQRRYFRALLLERKADLCDGVERTVDHLRHDTSSLPDEMDRAAWEEECSLELRTRDRERKLLKKIDAALSLIDRGIYGYCASCQKDIGIARLKARPTATLCLECKKHMEDLEQ